MKIGIIVHSFTGHTFSVAERLEQAYSEAGHQVKIERLAVVGGENPQNKSFKLERVPDIGAYDALVFGAPVRGFALSPVMSAYFARLPRFQKKKAACFVTMSSYFKFVGGYQAIHEMKETCGKKGMEISETGIICWSQIRRDKNIDEMGSRFLNAF